MHICYDNKPQQQIVWSYKIIVPFKRFELFLFSIFFILHESGINIIGSNPALTRMEHICFYDTNQCTDQWMDISILQKQQKHNNVGAGQGKMSQRIK